MTVKVKGGRPTKEQVEKQVSFKKEFPQKLIESAGMIVTACRKAGIATDTYYRWYNEDEDFKQQCIEAQTSVVESIANTILKIGYKNDNLLAFFHFMKHKGYLIGMGEKGGRTKFADLETKSNTVKEINQSYSEIIDKLKTGVITADDANTVANLLEGKRKAIVGEELEERLKAVEEQLNKPK